MQFEQVFTSTIEVGIATAGFSGIVAALGRRARGKWSPADLARISILLEASLASILLSYLALLLHGAGAPEPLIWRLGSGAFAIYASLLIGVRIRQARRLRETDSSVPLAAFRVVILVVVIPFTIFQAYNAVFIHAGWPFALAVVFELSMALVIFVRMVQTLWEGTAAEPDAP